MAFPGLECVKEEEKKILLGIDSNQSHMAYLEQSETRLPNDVPLIVRSRNKLEEMEYLFKRRPGESVTDEDGAVDVYLKELCLMGDS